MNPSTSSKLRLVVTRGTVIVRSFIDRCNAMWTYWYLRRHGVTTRPGYVQLRGRPIIQRFPGSQIVLGSGCILVSSSRYNPAGICHPVVLATLRANARIELVGQNGLSGSTICAAESVIVGEHSGMGANSSIFDTDFHPIDPMSRRRQQGIDASVKVSPVTVASDVWIGANAMVLKGVTIGEAAVIAAGSIVTRDVQAFSIVAGNPARLVRKLNG